MYALKTGGLPCLSNTESPPESVYDEIDAQLKVGQEQAEAQAKGREGEEDGGLSRRLHPRGEGADAQGLGRPSEAGRPGEASQEPGALRREREQDRLEPEAPASEPAGWSPPAEGLRGHVL